MTVDPRRGVVCTEWRACERGTLRGFATVRVGARNLMIADIAIHKAESGKRWAQLPAKPMLDRSRQLVVEGGKVRYSKVLWFENHGVARRFSEAVLRAVDARIAGG